MSGSLFDFDALEELEAQQLPVSNGSSVLHELEALNVLHELEAQKLQDKQLDLDADLEGSSGMASSHSLDNEVLWNAMAPEEQELMADEASCISDDDLSEVWLGEQFRDPGKVGVGGVERRLLKELEAGEYDDDPWEESDEYALDADDLELFRELHEAGEAAEVWEVVFGPRIVVRSAPRLSAKAIGIGSKQELFFSDPHFSDDEWVKLSHETGYILKDGGVKDVKLGVLIQPYNLGGVPESDRQTVIEILRSAWVHARQRNGNMFLKPPFIAKLRQIYEDAVQSAQENFDTCCEFDLEDFKACFKAGEEALAATQVLLLPSPDTGPGGASSSDSAGQAGYLSHGTGGTGSSYYGSSAPCTVPVQDGPTISLAAYNGEVTPAFASALLGSMRERSLPSEDDVRQIVRSVTAIMQCQESLVKVEVPPGATLHVVGDLHGQFWDLLHIIETYGTPSKDNWYVFNGDFVDRGQFSVEVVLALFAFKVALPEYVHLNRGNHESFRMNLIYGFMAEVKRKYSAEAFGWFEQAFKNLPLATVVNRSVFIVHGGLARQDHVSLEDIARVDRRREPDECAPELMVDLLWSDPMEGSGRGRSARGAGVLFGPDVTKHFCEMNGLTCVIRSHEMKYEGYEWQHNQMCLTVFSAANYCDMCGNFGAVCDITPREAIFTDMAPKIAFTDMNISWFEASPHPHEQVNFGGFPMMQQQNLFGNILA